MDMMPHPLPKNAPARRAARALLEKGLTYHRAAQLGEAIATYIAVLRLEPRNSEAARFLGVAYCTQGKLAEAIVAFREAVKFRPESAEAHFGLGDALQFSNQLDDAVLSYRQALHLRPAYPEACSNLGNALAGLGRFEEAIASFRASLAIKPSDARVLNNLSEMYRSLGRAEEALECSRAAVAIDPAGVEGLQLLAAACEAAKDTGGAVSAYRRLLRIDPRSTQTNFRLGRALQADHQHGEAVTAFRRTLVLAPHDADASLELGVSLAELERWNEARHAYLEYQTIRPESPTGWTNIGITFTKERRFPEAIETLQKAAALKPGDKLILRHLGIAYWSDKRWDEAIASARLLLSYFPDDAEGLNNLVVALTAKRMPVEAEAVLSHLLALQPLDAGVHVNRGNLQLSTGCVDEALASFQTARRLAPSLHIARQYEGMVQLLKGELQAGWENHEVGLDSRALNERIRFDRPLLEPGESLDGRVVLVHAEQGLGDTIQFARYLPLLAAKGAVVYLEVQPTLKPLMGDLPGVEAVFARGERLPEFGCHCPMLRLPYCLGKESDVIPPVGRSVCIPTERVSKWSSRLGVAAMPRIGVVWSGNPKHGNDHNRSIPFSEFTSLFDVPGVQFFNLQKEVSAGDATVLGARTNVIDLSKELCDFADTAGAVEQLDLVITVDTSVAHLAGSLGKPIWILLPFAPDWRWLLDRTDSPWYPTATLFRQSAVADWEGPLKVLSERLRGFSSRLPVASVE